MTKFLNISTDNTLGGNSPSDDVVSSQKAIKTALNAKANSADLATVATSGSYTDLSNKPTIPTVDQTYSSTSSNAQSGIAVKSAINSKLDKLTYEWNNATNFGATGKLCIGKFCCYDTNITIDIDATTNITYHGTLVIALQNIGTSTGTLVATVYGDATNTIAPNLYIYKHGGNDCLIEVYFSPRPWSKNIIHIRAVNLNKDHGSVSYDSVAFDLFSSVSEIPAAATIQPTNALDSKQATLVSGTNIKTVNGNSLLGSGNITISGSVAWGNVTGTLSNQTDLWSALTNIDCGTM